MKTRAKKASATSETDAAAYVGTAMRGRLDDLALLQSLAAEDDQTDFGKVGALMAMSARDVSEAGQPYMAEQAEEALDEFPLCVERMVSFEVVLGTGGPDDRLIIECDTVERGAGHQGFALGLDYEIRRVLYRYSWEGSGEVVLRGEDRKVAENFARRVVPELVE
jgi:hypothetical protein